MTIFLIILLSVVIVAGIYILLRGRHTPSRARRAARSAVTAQIQTGSLARLQENRFFWGAELSQPGCAESRELMGRQFPFAQAPALPLSGCTHRPCTCQFRGLQERRTSHRRLQPDRRVEVRFDKTHPDRRRNAGRRRGDRWVHHTL
ncbi:MAG: hypothetical protein WBO34_11075 [Gammaproteobacteria bacterium]